MSYSDVAFHFKPRNKIEADCLIGWVMQTQLIPSPPTNDKLRAYQLIEELNEFMAAVYRRIPNEVL